MNPNKLFTRLIHNGDIVFDVGAFKGFFAEDFSNLVGKNGKVFELWATMV